MLKPIFGLLLGVGLNSIRQMRMMRDVAWLMSRALWLGHGGGALLCRIPADIVDMSQGIRPKFVRKCLPPGKFCGGISSGISA